MTTPAFSPSHGSKAEVFWNGYALSLYASKATTSTQRDKADATTFRSVVKGYTYGLVDPSMTITAFYQGGVDSIDEAMTAAMGAGDGIISHFPAGASLGTNGKSIVAEITKYEITSEIASTVGVSIEASAGTLGVMDAYSVAGAFMQSVAASGNASSVDFGTASTNVGSLVVHGYTNNTTMTVKLQDSADNSTFADVVTLTFTGGTSTVKLRQAQRGVTSAVLRRYARVSWSGTGYIEVAAIGR